MPETLKTGRTKFEWSLRDSSNPIHRPTVYFIELALPINFKTNAFAQASLANERFVKFARKAI